MPNRKSYHILNGSEWLRYLGSLINMKYSLSLLKDWVFSFYSNLKLKDNQSAKRSPPVNLGMFEENKQEMKKQMLSNFRHVLLKINYWPHQVKYEGRPWEVYRADIHTSECHCCFFFNLVLLNIASLGCVYNNSQNIFM